MDVTSFVVAVTGFVAVGVYLLVGWRFANRRVAPENRLPILQFGLFWVGLAAVTAVGAIDSGTAAFTTPSLPIVLTLYYLEILLLCAALWGLVGYLIRLYTGRAYLAPLTALYAVLYVLLLYFITASGPNMLTVQMGTVGLQYATPVGGPILGVLVVILLLPEFLGAILYFTLFFRTRDPTARYRIALVSWGLIAWFVIGILNVGGRLGGGPLAEGLQGALEIFAALVVLSAYYPPSIVRRRFGVTGVETTT